MLDERGLVNFDYLILLRRGVIVLVGFDLFLIHNFNINEFFKYFSVFSGFKKDDLLFAITFERDI